MSTLLVVVLFLLVLGVSVAVFVATFVPLGRNEWRRMLLLLLHFAAGLSLVAGALVVLLSGGSG